MSIIEMQRVTKDFGNGRGIFDVNLQVSKGHVMGFLGPNGAGKTTAIRQLLGYSRPQKGLCQIDGMDCFTNADQIAKKIGYLPGELAFMDEMTGQEFIQFVGHLRGMSDFQKAKKLEEFFHFDTKQSIRKMSKGTKQKLGIICAFMHEPDIYILDEPTSGLDPLMQNHFVELVLAEKEKGKTILMSSHIFEEIEKTCDEVAIIREGHIVTVDTIAHLTLNQVQVFQVTFSTEGNCQSFKASYPCRSLSHLQVEVSIQGDMTAFLQDLVTYHACQIKQVPQNLEERFMHFYGGQTNELGTV